MAKTKAGEGSSLVARRSKSVSRRSSSADDAFNKTNIENGLYVHSSPPKVVSSGEGSSGSANIREYLRGGNISGLEDVVLEGNGNKLLSQSSTDPRVRAFLKTLPAFMSKIDLVHDAAERGNLRDLKSLLDRRKIAKSKDSQGMGLLHKAVLSGNTELVEYLVRNYPETTAVTDHALAETADTTPGNVTATGHNITSGYSTAAGDNTTPGNPLASGDNTSPANVTATGNNNTIGNATTARDNTTLGHATATGDNTTSGKACTDNTSDNTTLGHATATGDNTTSGKACTDNTSDNSGNIKTQNSGEVIGGPDEGAEDDQDFADILDLLNPDVVINVDDLVSNNIEEESDEDTFQKQSQVESGGIETLRKMLKVSINQLPHGARKSSEAVMPNAIVENEDEKMDSDDEFNDDEAFYYGLDDLFLEDIIEEEGNEEGLSETCSIKSASVEKSLAASMSRQKEESIGTTSGTSSGTRASTNEKYVVNKNIDLSASMISFTKKDPLPPTASRHRTKIEEIDDPLLGISHFSFRRRLTPVHNPKGPPLVNSFQDEDTCMKLILPGNKLQPIEQHVRFSSENVEGYRQTGAIPKRFSGISKAINSKIDQVSQYLGRRRSSDSLSLQSLRLSETASSHTPHPISSTPYQVVPNSANIRELKLRRNKIQQEHLARVVREQAFLEYAEEEDMIEGHGRNSPSGTLKLPQIISDDHTADKVNMRPSTPTAMPRSAKDRPLGTRAVVDGQSVVMMNFQDSAYEGQKHVIRSARNRKKKKQEAAEGDQNSSSSSKTNLFRLAKLQLSLGNIISDNAVKNEKINENELLSEINGKKLESVATLTGQCKALTKSQYDAEIVEQLTLLPESLQRYCRRLTGSISASVQNDLSHVFKREISKSLAREDTLQTVYEHDIGYWAKDISERILGQVTEQEQLTGENEVTDLTASSDSGINTGTLTASTQTSTPDSRSRSRLEDIAKNLEILNVKLVSGRPVYRSLVEQARQDAKLEMFKERWLNKRSISSRK